MRTLYPILFTTIFTASACSAPPPALVVAEQSREFSFFGILHKHNYSLAKTNSDKPEVILIADLHSKPVRARHCALLEDLLQLRDMLLLEGYAGEYQYPDLQQEAFNQGNMPPALQKIIRDNARNIPSSEAAITEPYYVNIPNPLYGLEDAVLQVYLNDAFFSMHKTKNNHELYDAYVQRHAIAFYHRNIALARTIARHYFQNPDDGKTYVILGAQHVLTADELQRHGITIVSTDILAGHVTALLERINQPYAAIPYAVIIPADIAEEKKKVDADKSLRLDNEARETIIDDKTKQ